MRARQSMYAGMVLFGGLAYPQTNVLTYQYDNSRAGANTAETTLIRANVNPVQFGKIFGVPVDGYIYGQPLVFGNMVYAATEHDSVYAFNANSGGAPVWQVSFLNAAAGVTPVPSSDTSCGQIQPEIGITSTPVIEPATNTIYVVAMTKEVIGSTATYVHQLHALDTATGTEKPGSPVVIQATYPGTGEHGTTLTFNAKNYKQRPGLLLLNGVVYTAWSSHCDIGAYHGWLMGYDSDTLKQVSVWNNTPNGNEGSFWAGGAAPAADSAGNIFLNAGNGTFDASANGSDFGESFVRLATVGGLSVADYFTPFNYSDLNAHDLDTGSAGVAFLGDEAGSAAHSHLMASAGKEGRIYLLDRDRMGKLQAGSDSQIVQSVQSAVGGLFGNPAYFNKSLYFCGSGQKLSAFSVVNGAMSTTPVSQGSENFGFPGCVPTVSSNGVANGIVWVTDPSGIVRAYDASNLGHELYNSNQIPARDTPGRGVKFSVPSVANGRVYVGKQNALEAYGLLPAGTSNAAIANAASGDAAAVAPESLAALYGGFPAATSLGNTSITVNGIPAPVFYASPSQINFEIPAAVTDTAATATVVVNGAASASATVPIHPVAPGLFLIGQGTAAAVNPDGTVNSAAHPAAVGSYIAVYLTGLGAVNPAGSGGLSTVAGMVSATVGNQPATVQFAGLAPGFTGLYQVNVLVPQVAGGPAMLQVTVSGISSNSAPISVR